MATEGLQKGLKHSIYIFGGVASAKSLFVILIRRFLSLFPSAPRVQRASNNYASFSFFCTHTLRNLFLSGALRRQIKTTFCLLEIIYSRYATFVRVVNDGPKEVEARRNDAQAAKTETILNSANE